MTATWQRALLLHHQGRHGDAERELRQHLSGDPHDPLAHALLAMCLAEQERFDAAEQEADAAVGLGPDVPMAHFARARVLTDRRRYAEAEAAVREAIRLDPDSPSFFSLLAAILYEQNRWADALAAAERGLEVDPEHDGCVNFRAMALVKLGRRDEAGATIGAALARDPGNELTHANQGWAQLHRGEHRKALEHFREALRLNPNFEYARAGVVEALKARHLIYRWMLRYFLWMSRLGGRARWGIILGGWFGYQLLRGVVRSNPETGIIAYPLMIAYVGFVLLTWLSVPLFNLLLRLNRYGRYALSREQRITSNWVALLLLAAAGCVVAGLATGADVLISAALICFVLVFPASAVMRCERGWPRAVMLAATLALAAVGAGIIQADLAHAHQRGGALFLVFLVATLASLIAANWLSHVRTTR